MYSWRGVHSACCNTTVNVAGPSPNSQPHSIVASIPVSRCVSKLSLDRTPCTSLKTERAPAIVRLHSSSTPPVSWTALLTDQETLVRRLEELYRLNHPRLSAWTNLAASEFVDGMNSLGSETFAVQLGDPPSKKQNNSKDDDFYANAGHAVRTLREDIPQLFVKDLNYDIYRDDIVFRDPRNTFTGIKNYQTIFWSLRFHGRLFFKLVYVEILRVWQPEEKVIKMRWKVHGFPRLPWRTEGTFDGISQFKLDGHGKIYEHYVDNVIFRDPPGARFPLFANLTFTPLNQPVQQPCPGAWCKEQEAAPEYLTRHSLIRVWLLLQSTLNVFRQKDSNRVHHFDVSAISSDSV